MAVIGVCGVCGQTYDPTRHNHLCPGPDKKAPNDVFPDRKFNEPASILEEAARIVDGPRKEDYGTPNDNHSRTAALWNAYFSLRHMNAAITARDVCMLNILQKISRDRHAPKRDNLVDIAGYARNAELCEQPNTGVGGPQRT